MILKFINIIGSHIILIVFLMLMSCNSINTNDYFFEIEQRKDEADYDVSFLFVYHQKNEKKILIDSMISGLFHDFTPYIRNNYLYQYWRDTDVGRNNKYIIILKHKITDDSLIYIDRFSYRVGLVKDCQCVFENNTATITCDSAIYKVDLASMKFK